MTKPLVTMPTDIKSVPKILVLQAPSADIIIPEIIPGNKRKQAQNVG